jgi:sulfur-carrier protein
MAKVIFTPNLQRHLACPPVEAAGSTVREVLEAAFAGKEQARGYVLDDQAALRKHMAIFVNGTRIRDRVHLSDPVPADAEVYVLQALSGG